MGLDMWIYSGVKPNENRIAKNPHTKDLWNTNYHYYNKNDMNDDEVDLKDLLPICIERKGKTTYTDWNKLRQEHNVPEDAHQGGFSCGPEGIKIYFYSNDENHTRYEISLTHDEYNQYDYDTDIDLYITELVEISYWRKSYELQEHIYEVYKEFSGKDITNCGYHHLTKEMIQKLNKIDKEFAAEYFSENEDSLYYHEWY